MPALIRMVQVVIYVRVEHEHYYVLCLCTALVLYGLKALSTDVS